MRSVKPIYRTELQILERGLSLGTMKIIGPWELCASGLERRAVEVAVTRWQYRERPCDHCHVLYMPTRLGHVYCTKACGNQAWVREHRPGKQP